MKRFIIFALLCTLLCVTAFASDGIVISQGEYYYSDTPLSILPSTFEAEVKFPSTIPAGDRGGVILGNYDGQNVCVNFEIYTSGQPRLYIMDKTGGAAYNFVFSSVNVFNDAWTHIAIVKDSENSLVHCYINGKLAQTLSVASPVSATFTTQMILGGDRRPDNSMYMKGSIRRLALYSDVRTAAEIAYDYSCDTYDADGILSYYTMECDGNGYEPLVIEDLAGDNDFTRYAPWMKEAPALSDYAYSFAVVGDTQIMNCYYPGEFHHIYDYITENAEENKLKFVFGLGDITDKDTDLEWALAKSLITDLDGVVPYSLVRGNHDSAAKYKKYVTYDNYTKLLDGTFDGSVLNAYQKLYVGGRKYLIFSLDYGASDEVLNWAGGIIEAHSDYNVIITTHAYLYRDGTTLDQNDVCPPATSGGYNNGDHIWDKLIKKHKNIVLVLSGHDPCDNVVLTQTKGE
ncbi:MAG: metallophosphoesterase, partial [Clostridia bacterium]|nr:metallophosphoesterase [Clostridia bacterium]